MQSILENFLNSTTFILKKSFRYLQFFPTRSFTKSIAVPVFAIAMPETGMTPHRHRRLGTGRQPTSSLRRRGVTRALFAPRLNLDADYYASRLVSRRNLNDAASFNTLRRDDGVIRRFPEAVARGNHHQRRNAKTFTWPDEPNTTRDACSAAIYVIAFSINQLLLLFN